MRIFEKKKLFILAFLIEMDKNTFYYIYDIWLDNTFFFNFINGKYHINKQIASSNKN